MKRIVLLITFLSFVVCNIKAQKEKDIILYKNGDILYRSTLASSDNIKFTKSESSISFNHIQNGNVVKQINVSDIDSICFKPVDESDNGLTINAANVINGSSDIATVKAEVYWETGDWSTDNYDYGYETIAEAPYKNNGFTLKLPATVSAQYLDPIMEDGDEVFIEGITVSDKTVNGISFEYFNAYDNNDDEIGELYYLSGVDDYDNYSDASWFYVDKDVTINGQNISEYESYSEEDIIIFDNFTLKKGWNIAYGTYTHTYNQSTQIDTYTFIYSNQKPSGVTFIWYFDNFLYQNYAAPLKSTNSFSKNKSFFSNFKQIKHLRVKSVH